MIVEGGQFVERAVFFYGSTTDLSIPAPNEAFCTTTVTWDNPLVDCFFGAPQNLLGAAHDGIATIETC